MSNVFVFSFSEQGIEAIVNLSAIDEEYVLAKMGDKRLPQSVSSIISMMTVRAQFNQQRRMEVWLLKLNDDFTEDELLAIADEDPQQIADMARMGEVVYQCNTENRVIT
jgi:endonuclease/exonuclease/phosphatase (EEP) superfamily protein YafD